MKNSSRSYDFLWLGFALLPLISISFLLAVQPQDYWWVMRVGQETIQNGVIPTTDTISLSQFGQPIIYQTWLSGIVFWLIYKIGGISFTFLLRGILIGTAYGLTWSMVRKVSNAPLATVLVFHSRHCERKQLVCAESTICISAFCALLMESQSLAEWQ